MRLWLPQIYCSLRLPLFIVIIQWTGLRLLVIMPIIPLRPIYHQNPQGKTALTKILLISQFTCHLRISANRQVLFDSAVSKFMRIIRLKAIPRSSWNEMVRSLIVRLSASATYTRMDFTGPHPNRRIKCVPLTNPEPSLDPNLRPTLVSRSNLDQP